MEIGNFQSVSSNIAGTYTKTTNKDGSVTESLEFNASKSEVSASFSKDAAVYEKGDQDKIQDNYGKKNTDRSALIEQLKADQKQMKTNLFNIVMKTISGQGNAFALASENDMWKFLASGKFTADADTIAKAKEDISEDGYWGVNQTSDRIVDFAIALSGGDASKADTLLEAFKKGFSQATGTWGKDLPDISSKTYDAVVDKFQSWKDGTYKSGNDNAKEATSSQGGASLTYVENYSTVNSSTYVEL